jgi:hypothetical protein
MMEAGRRASAKAKASRLPSEQEIREARAMTEIIRKKYRVDDNDFN